MDAEQRRRKGTVHNRRLWRRYELYFGLWMLALSGLVYLSLTAGAKESRIRRDQTCVVFERQHQADVKRLVDTYQYLVQLSKAQLREPLNAAIARQLPDYEEIARESKPPPYCRGDVGIDDRKLLPIPPRPRDLP